jgi:hypothetical protein
MITMIIKKTSLVVGLALMVLLVSACARHGAALIVSEPPGAEVWDMSDDTLFGVTPVKAWWKEHGERRKFVNIRLQKDGYRDKTTSFWVNLEHGARKNALKNAPPVEVILEKQGEQ